MKKSTIKRLGFVVVGLALAYSSSYLLLSRSGRYEPVAFRLGGGPDGELLMVPMRFGYEWKPAAIFRDDGSGDIALMILYWPMIGLDQSLWHTDARMYTWRYPVVNWFDIDSRTYRTVEPNNGEQAVHGNTH